jgi:cell wall-associated NlpC family hydrolase
MKIGDLIFYTNSAGVVDHVAIYIGNNQIVHAASARAGIRISKWNYRTPYAIRNVLGK